MQEKPSSDHIYISASNDKQEHDGQDSNWKK
jgi:hypothetical protein